MINEFRRTFLKKKSCGLFVFSKVVNKLKNSSLIIIKKTVKFISEYYFFQQPFLFCVFPRCVLLSVVKSYFLFVFGFLFFSVCAPNLFVLKNLQK